MDKKTKAQIQQEGRRPGCQAAAAFRQVPHHQPRDGPAASGIWLDHRGSGQPQVIIESTFGDSHPGSAGRFELVEEVRAGVAEAGGHGARYFCTDICDAAGPRRHQLLAAQSRHDRQHDRDPSKRSPFDAGVFVASCDKVLRTSWPSAASTSSIVVTGGVINGPDLLTLEQLGAISARYERGEISREELEFAKHNACPSCGACSFMGTASTMQVTAGPGHHAPRYRPAAATSSDLREFAGKASQSVWLSEHNLCPRDIVTKESFENLIMVHGAISGSTNSLLHIPAIAREFGIEMSADDFDRLHRGAHYLLNVRPAGEWPAQFFYYAGGVPRIMEEIKSMLHLDVMTVTGKTSAKISRTLRTTATTRSAVVTLRSGISSARTSSVRLTPLRHRRFHRHPPRQYCSRGAVVKHTVVPREMFQATLKARPFVVRRTLFTPS